MKDDAPLTFSEQLDGNAVIVDVSATRREFFAALRDDEAVRDALVDVLVRQPFEAYCFETPPFSPSSAERPASFAVVDSPRLAEIRANPEPFRKLFDGAGPIVTFPNLSSDAGRVSPNTSAMSDGAHLAAFVRAAPRTLSRALWAAVGEAVMAHATPDPLWVGTAGLGVCWLHVRLDQHPKYYRYAPFKPRGA